MGPIGALPHLAHQVLRKTPLEATNPSSPKFAASVEGRRTWPGTSGRRTHRHQGLLPVAVPRPLPASLSSPTLLQFLSRSRSKFGGRAFWTRSPSPPRRGRGSRPPGSRSLAAPPCRAVRGHFLQPCGGPNPRASPSEPESTFCVVGEKPWTQPSPRSPARTERWRRAMKAWAREPSTATAWANMGDVSALVILSSGKTTMLPPLRGTKKLHPEWTPVNWPRGLLTGDP